MRIIRTIKTEQPGDVWIKQKVDAASEEMLALDVADAVARTMRPERRADALYIEVNLEVSVVRVIARETIPSQDAPAHGSPQP